LMGFIVLPSYKKFSATTMIKHTIESYNCQA
jgi:hypothetical protein